MKQKPRRKSKPRLTPQEIARSFWTPERVKAVNDFLFTTKSSEGMYFSDTAAFAKALGLKLSICDKKTGKIVGDLT